MDVKRQEKQMPTGKLCGPMTKDQMSFFFFFLFSPNMLTPWCCMRQR